MKKILIVEDDLVLSTTLTDNLVQEGFETIRASNGEEGLAFALRHKPDLVLLDILMPKMNGLTMLEKLRQDPWGKTVPVIVLSNLGDTADVAAAVGEDVREYLVKINWKIEDVIKKIREKLMT